MKDINLTLIHCQEFHPFTQAKRKLVTHGEEERKEEKERNHHNFHLKQNKNYNKRNKENKERNKNMVLISQPRCY